MPSRLIENLRLLDSHERGLLLQWTADEPFRLGEPIRAEVARLTGSRPAPDAFIAMDYTLDWLYAAVQRTVAADEAWPRPWPDSDELAASQEDVDLLIAWDDQAGTHLTLIEAKGFTGWSNRVMSRKTDRIEAIFPPQVRELFDVHFVLAGPAPSAASMCRSGRHGCTRRAAHTSSTSRTRVSDWPSSGAPPMASRRKPTGRTGS